LGHGTQDASMLGAIGNNDTAMVGEAWGTGMLSIRIFDSNGQAPETTVQTGIDALEQIMSTFGSQAPVGVIDMDVVFPAPTPGLETSIQQAAARGLVTVSPTGDECLNAADYPARYRTNGQIAVSGSDQLDEPMFFSQSDCANGGSHGLESSLDAGQTTLEVHGAEAAIAEAFRAPLRYFISPRGRTFIANAAAPTLPAALAAVVAGPLSLNSVGRGTPGSEFDRTDPNMLTAHALAPADFAKIYNAAPLYAAGIDGRGVTVAVVARTDIPLTAVTDFRASLLPSYPQSKLNVIHNGEDPGVLPVAAETDEAALDAQWAGAVAPAATVDFVVSASTDVTDGTDLSAEYIVDHALAPIMSSSFGACEAALGGPGSAANLFYQNLYEQAAAEGITAVVSSGDTGAAGCDSTDAPASQGLGVNGLASTPYNLAVGGTQFNDSQGTYWAATNSATDFSSALGYIPEWAWNESCVNGSCIAAGGGGRSAIYPKPDWQNAPGVPGDGARDLPDVSFNASEGIPYLTCAGMNCQPGQYTTAAGTSASTQAFASALALLVQETGEWQGLIAPELYRFAASQPAGACNAATGSNPNCIFNDVTTGSNAVPCTGGSPNCANGDTAQGDGSPAYPGGVGYDLATGLGSVNIANLINAWPTSAPAASQTTLSVSPGAITHGQSVTCQVSVSSG